jgi:hypothetical protein
MAVVTVGAVVLAGSAAWALMVTIAFPNAAPCPHDRRTETVGGSALHPEHRADTRDLHRGVGE